MRRIIGAVLFAAGCSGCQGCGPQLDALDPPEGPPRTVVAVEGDVFGASILWDAGTPQEVHVAGMGLFSVPASASPGAHRVQLMRMNRRSNVLEFRVTPPVFYPPRPRVDRVSLLGTDFPTPQTVRTWLLVQAANGDVGGEVLIDGQPAFSAALKAMRNDLFGIDARHFDYPVHHWTAYACFAGERAVGESLGIQFRNPDGGTSEQCAYTLPVDAAQVDSDGDDIPDVWETGGYADNGVVHDLAALGADPYRPDIFVEVDVMPGLSIPPQSGVFDAVRAGFDAAPILNVLAADGINLILDLASPTGVAKYVKLRFPDDASDSGADFYALKAVSMDRLQRLYHYCIWGDQRTNGNSGKSDFGNDFAICMGEMHHGLDPRYQAQTFMHELGHDLAQLHGGQNHSPFSPTYSSVMTYSWQMRVNAGSNDWWRVKYPIYHPLYYADASNQEPNGYMPATAAVVLDYSDGMGRTLKEDALNESTGLYGVSIDWNGDGSSTGTSVSANLDDRGSQSDELTDYPNWVRLDFTGPRLGGTWKP